MARRARIFAAALGVVATAACGGGSGPSHVPPPGAPTISCPANIHALAHNGNAPTVTFDTPVPQGGQSPVAVVCSPASDSVFQVGTTPVVCTATDARGQTGNCTFNVDVSPVPQLAVTNFMAFGDSLTEGTTSSTPTILTVNPPDSYPYQLQAMLAARYLDQTIVVVNEGKAGQQAKDDVSRFVDAVRRDTPQVVLLMHGANDILNSKEDGIRGVLTALEEMIHEAKSRGAVVFLATLPPQNPEGSRGGGAEALPDLNRGIIHTAADEGATLVDINAQMGTYVGYIGVDGLHPTPVGYQKIAEIWRDAIQAAYEKPATVRPGDLPATLHTAVRRR